MRVEQFYPWNAARWREVAARHAGVAEVVWAQEESRNRGGWTFMFPRLLELFPGKPIGYAGRAASASPATGSLRIHKREQQQLVLQALGLAE